MGSNSSVSLQDKSILNLKLQRDRLKQYQTRIQIVLDRETEIAKEALQLGNKKRALTALRQRKYQETLLTQTDSQLSTLQQLVSSIEFSLVEKDVLFGLKQGTSVLKQLSKEMNLEMVEQLMSDSAEGIAYQKEVDLALQSKITAGEEEEVQEELEKLLQEQLAATLPTAPITSLPDPIISPTAEQEPLPTTAEEGPTRSPEARQAMLA